MFDNCRKYSGFIPGCQHIGGSYLLLLLLRILWGFSVFVRGKGGNGVFVNKGK